MRKMLLNSTLFLMVGILNSCSEQAIEVPKVNWEFYQQKPGDPVKACLPQDEMNNLREALDRCKSCNP
jgi:hypothetical protein